MLTQNEATRFVAIIDARIDKALGRGTVTEMTYGDVDVVSGDRAAVFIGGDGNSSQAFRIPAGMVVQPGDRVRVSIDPRGFRRVEEVLLTSGSAKATVDPVRGDVASTTVTLGGGPILRKGGLTKELQYDTGGATAASRFTIQATAGQEASVTLEEVGDTTARASFQKDRIEFGPGGTTTRDANLYRYVGGAIVMRTDNELMADSFTAEKTGIGFRFRHAGDGDSRWRINDGSVQWGDGTNTPDVTLYRGAADTLKSDDKFDPTSLNLQVKAGAPVDGDITGGAASGDIVLDTTNSKLYCRVGSTWKSVTLT